MFEVGTIDFAVYEDAVEFIGMAKAELPDKNQKVITINGARIGGDVEMPIPGHYDAMSLTLSFRNYTKKQARLREQRRHQIDLRISQLNEDPVSGELIKQNIKHVFVVVPKSASGGTVAPAASSNNDITFSVRYWAIYMDGTKVDEIDQLNGIDIANGIDYYADVRKALGKS